MIYVLIASLIVCFFTSIPANPSRLIANMRDTSLVVGIVIIVIFAFIGVEASAEISFYCL